jgi:hypothetical protein
MILCLLAETALPLPGLCNGYIKMPLITLIISLPF